MSAVAIRESVDLVHEPMVKADSEFIGFVGLVFDPVAGIAEQDSKKDRNVCPIASDILIRPSEAASPFPDLPKHAPVNIFEKVFIENVDVDSREKPRFCLQNVCLLKLI